MSVCVTQVDSPSSVYIQYMQQEDPEYADVNTQLQALVHISTVLNAEDAPLEPLTEEIKQGKRDFFKHGGPVLVKKI